MPVHEMTPFRLSLLPFPEKVGVEVIREKLLPPTPPPVHCNLRDKIRHQHSTLFFLLSPAVGRSRFLKFPLPFQAQPGLYGRGGRLLAWPVRE